MAEAGCLSFDEDAWPLITATCPESLGKESVDHLVVFFERIHAKKELFALIIDTRPVKAMPSATWRKDIVRWAGDPRVQANSERYNVGTAVVLTSTFTRGIFTALGWIWKPASPIAPLPAMVDAVAWCCAALARKGAPRSPRLIELQRSLASPPRTPHRG
jgi:hypothetical protein